MLEQFREEVHLSRASAEAGLERRAELRDLREASRAHTSALLKLLDRLDGPGGSSATA